MEHDVYFHFDNKVDVFSGTGWNNWSRFEKTDKGIRLVGGLPVKHEQFKRVKHVLSACSTRRVY